MADYLVDTNIVLYYLDASSPYHADTSRAVRILADHGNKLILSVQNVAEMWSALTKPATKNGYGYTAAIAESLLVKAEIVFPVLPDPPNLYAYFRALLVSAGVLGSKVHDCRLAAWMLAYGISLILTENSDDFQFPGVAAVEAKNI